nr:MAG TPA: hypothetical protein [Crassvirales sp.]
MISHRFSIYFSNKYSSFIVSLIHRIFKFHFCLFLLSLLLHLLLC